MAKTTDNLKTRLHPSGLSDSDIEMLVSNPTLSRLFDFYVYDNPHMPDDPKLRRIALYMIKDILLPIYEKQLQSKRP